MKSGVFDRDDFPWWYTVVKWGIPLTLAAVASTWMMLILTGYVPAFGMLKWAPAFFSQLEGLAAFSVMSIAMGAIASMVGVGAAFLIRGAILFGLTEAIATRAQFTIDELKRKYDDLEKGASKTEAERQHITTLYDMMRGANQGKDQPAVGSPDVPLQPAPQIQQPPEVESEVVPRQKKTATRRR